MTNEWKELKTLQEVAAAQAAGEEIEILSANCTWIPWNTGMNWMQSKQYRSRPKKRTKKIMLREAVLNDGMGGVYVLLASKSSAKRANFVRWLDTPAREVEVEE